MKRQFWPVTFLIPGLCVTPAAFADADAEREALAKVIHELNALESLINRAPLGNCTQFFNQGLIDLRVPVSPFQPAICAGRGTPG